MTPSRRYAMIARLRPERRAEYRELHRRVWPEVERAMSAHGIRNFTIFDLDGVLVGYYEYVGDDHDADQAAIAADPVSQAWWRLTDPCQIPFLESSGSPNWEPLAELWHLD